MMMARRDWIRFTNKMSAVNTTAGRMMQTWIAQHGTGDIYELIDVAYMLVDKYGEASSALACEMYDAIADLQGAFLTPAEPAPTATYDETAKAIRGTLKNENNTVPATVSRLVKQAGADTMLQNAQRDRSQFAWVPNGDTCAFCLMLASNGWQYMSKKTLKHGHAEHIHANCDCMYAVRFDFKSPTIAGYDPQKYLDVYEAADGYGWRQKVDSIRREQYAENKDKINAQKRAAYAARKEKEGAAP